jgi:hypothetical protein
LVSPLRDEDGLKVFENRGVRGIIGPKADEVIGEWRKLHNLCSSPNIVKAIKSKDGDRSGTCSMHKGILFEILARGDHLEIQT